MNTTVDTTHGTKLALDIIEEGKRPMSIDEIKAKYQLDFPFRVEKVTNSSPVGDPVWSKSDVVTVVRPDYSRLGWYETGHYDEGTLCATPGDLKQWRLAEEKY